MPKDGQRHQELMGNLPNKAKQPTTGRDSALTAPARATRTLHVRSARIHPGRISQNARRTTSALDSRRSWSTRWWRRTARLHSGQGTPGLLEPVERGGLASAGSTRESSWSKARCGPASSPDELEEVQLLSRLLSTRHKTVQLAGRGRLSIPDGFREFLQVEQGGEVIVVGAGVCVEIWNPRAWLAYLESHMTEFRQLFDKLSS